MQLAINKRAIGINFTSENEAEVVLWAPKAKEVKVKLQDSEGQFDLKKADKGYWHLKTDGIKPGDRYKFLVDNQKELPDPASVFQPEGVHGSSGAFDLRSFQWSDKAWKNIPQEEYVIYELHTGTFTPEGTFSGLENKLDYLSELGINAIEIMPVSQFPGSRNWGYDGVFPFAVQNTYGGPKGLQHLVDTCHKKGIAVILDVVYNHLGPEGNYLGEFGHYFTDKYHTPWGKALNFDDAWCDPVRQYFIENVLMWFRDFHIDGLRMDAVHAIKDLGPKHILREIKEHVNALMKETGRKYYLIAEVDLNDPKYINPLEKNGFGLDGQWIDEFHHALRVASGNTKTGYYAEFEGVAHLAKSYKDAYVYDGIYSEHRKKTFGTPAKDNPGKQFVVFSQNHDQVGNRMLGERTTHLISFELRKLLAGAVMVSPYLPMLFMGEEYSESHPFLYFVSHGDPGLVEAVRKGRKAEFAEFHDQGEAPDPQSEKTFADSKLQWDLLEKEPHKTMLRFYRALIALRKTNPVLKNLNRHHVDATFNDRDQTLLLHRWHEVDHLLVLMNFSGNNQSIVLPTYQHHWHMALDASDPQWNGPGSAPEYLAGGEQMTILPESFLIYTNNA